MARETVADIHREQTFDEVFPVVVSEVFYDFVFHCKVGEEVMVSSNKICIAVIVKIGRVFLFGELFGRLKSVYNGLHPIEGRIENSAAGYVVNACRVINSLIRFNGFS
ncbi:unknown [Acidaminococcus sp. CAG:917]|nr:unknown [Acidaminococcus sp. CAG:917]